MICSPMNRFCARAALGILGIVLAAGLSPAWPAAASGAALTVGDGTRIPFTVYGRAGRARFLWLPSGAGFTDGEVRAARSLARDGAEVWMADLLAARFLPPLPSSLDRIPAGDVAALVQRALSGRGPLYLVAAGRGAIPLLRGMYQWQSSHPRRPGPAGAILLSPKFFERTPAPGRRGVLMPVVRATNLPIFLIQPARSPWRWKLDASVAALEQSGSDVFVQILPGIRDRFYFRPDATDREDALAGELGVMIHRAGNLLASLPRAARPAPERTPPPGPVGGGRQDHRLAPYAGDPHPPALDLPGLDGRMHSLKDYRGRVVLVNFWASWCPPCVHEMPSMERLRRAMTGEPFTILAVNMAEAPARVRRFLARRVDVGFPVLLDRDGAALRRWGVFAFPTSFVVDRRGRIRYGAFGALDWNGAHVAATLRALLAEQSPP